MPLHTSTGAAYARIEGIGASLPSRVVDNTEMCTYIDSTDEWIQQRTGIRERRVAAADQASSDLALIACQRALEIALATMMRMLVSVDDAEHLFRARRQQEIVTSDLVTHDREHGA